MTEFEKLKKILKFATILFQIGLTVFTLLVYYMIMGMLNFTGGVDEMFGLMIFQPIMAFVLAFITMLICGLLGLPIRIHKKLNNWWRGHFYTAPAIVLVGLVLGIFSFFFMEQSEFEIDGMLQTVAHPNTECLVLSWFLMAFGLLHVYPPYMIQMRFVDYLEKRKQA